MKIKSTILAKPNETLIEHTENTLKVFKSIRESYPEVPEISGVPDFWEHLFYSLFFHDFGKAATGFQNSLKNNEHWKYRHEILSATFIYSLKDFYNISTIKAIGLGIITHHKDLNLLDGYDTFANVNMESFLEKLDEIKPNFDELISYFDLIPDFSEKYLGYKLKTPKKFDFDDLESPFEEVIYDYLDDYDDEEYQSIHGKYGIFLKGFMNACDHLASGEHYEILNGLKFGKLLKLDSLRTTQKLASKTEGSCFLIAPTGSGKTEASLLWSDNN